MNEETQQHRFRAMGTTVTAITGAHERPPAARRAARAVELVFAREEDRFSRFRPDSELTQATLALFD